MSFDNGHFLLTAPIYDGRLGFLLRDGGGGWGGCVMTLHDALVNNKCPHRLKRVMNMNGVQLELRSYSSTDPTVEEWAGTHDGDRACQ